MKRLQPRQAQRILTLSLMSSLSLLVACGGGGGKSAPAAAVVQSVEVDKTVAQAADPNEPYLVAPSGWSIAGLGTNLTLNVIDGISQSVKASISLDTNAGPKQWSVAEKWVKSGTQVTRVPASLFYVKGNKLFQTSLSRADNATTTLQLSKSTTVCTIESTYPLQYNSTDAALVVTVSDGTHACGSPTDQKAVITTQMTSASDPITPPTQKFTVLQNLYGDDGVLKGILVEKPSSDGTQAQLAAWSPNMDAEQTPKITLRDASTTPVDYSVYPLRDGNPAFGAQWVTNQPTTQLAGYVRIKVVLVAATLTTPEKTDTLLFNVTWADSGATASVVTASIGSILHNLSLENSAAVTTKGVTDGSYAYFVNGPYLSMGPMPVSALYPSPFRNFLIPTTIDSSTKLVAVNQSAKRILVTLQSGDSITVWAINKSDKTSGIVALGNATQGFQFLGTRGEFVYSVGKGDTSGTNVIIRADMSKLIPGTGYPILVERILSNVVHVGTLYEQNTTLTMPDVNSVLVCDAGSSQDGTCFNKPIKLFGFASNAYVEEVGTVNSDIATQANISGGKYATLSNALTVDFTLNSVDPITLKLDVLKDVYVFHPAAPRSLTQLTTPTPGSAASSAN